GNHLVVPGTVPVVWARWSLFVRLVSDSSAVRDLAGAAHPRTADLGVPFALCADACRLERLGNAVGKSDQHACQQAGLAAKTGPGHIDARSLLPIVAGDQAHHLRRRNFVWLVFQDWRKMKRPGICAGSTA